MSERQHRLHISPAMRAFLDYPKFQGQTRLLILETGYFFDASWKRAAGQLGWAVASVPSAMTGGLSRDDLKALFQTLATFKPDFILTSNMAGLDMHGLFEHFFEDARIPYVTWFTDTPRMLLFGRELSGGDYAVAATWDRAYIPHLKRAGFKHTYYMPHATDPDIFNGSLDPRPARALSFVGMSMIDQSTEAREKHAHRPDLVEAVMRAVDEGHVTREVYPEGLEAMLGSDAIQGLDDRERRNLELFLNYEATRREREALVRTLAPLGLEVRGDANWPRIHSLCGGAVGYFDGLAPYYRSTAVNINQTAVQMRWAVNQRVMDCPAAGGFLLTDAQKDLEELFEPDEMAVYGSTEELLDKLTFFQSHDAARRQMVTKAQSRIAAQHTHRQRLHDLQAMLANLYS